MERDEVVNIPIDGILDLHAFNPRDVKELIPEYLSECRRRGILDVRIIHGKGKGVLRATVWAMLERLPGILSYQTAGSTGGEWGATEIILAPAGKKRDG